MKKLVLFLLSLSVASASHGESTAYIPVGQAKTKKTVLAFPDVMVIEGGAHAKDIHEAVQNDLIFMDLFRFLPKESFIEGPAAGLTPERIKFSDWTGIGTEFLIKAGVTSKGNSLTLEGYLYDVYKGKQVLAKRYVGEKKNHSTIAHTFANDIVQALTGLPGVFLTKIAMSCNRTGKKEIYVMDFDGTNVRQITHHRSIALAPAWSPDGTKIAYSLYTRHKKNIKNIDLFEFDFLSNKIRLLSNRKGINSGAAYSPNGKEIALTMSFLGNPEVFILNLENRQARRLTKSFGFDVDPSWSPKGDMMAFVSTRTGKPMIHSITPNGASVKRLTYAGRYNATPSWSPQNNKIAFAGWLDDKFDIFVMNPDGTKIERLTKNQGNNEDPHFSPDGNFIVFSSDRTGTKNVYVMNIDGTYVKRLTYGLGDCVAPKWSNPPPQNS